MDPDDDQTGEYLISIIIATYNAGENLAACLSSIAALNMSGVEILVIDGGSTDQTISILETSTLNGLFWQTEPDNGIYEALNKGIRAARGRWFYFLGSDDLLLPGFAEMAGKLVSRNTVYYGIPKAYYLPGPRPDYILLGGKFSRYKMAKYCLNHQVIIYPAAVFLKYRYQTKYKIFADYVLNIQVWGDSDFKKKFIPLEIALYNMTGFSAKTKDILFEQSKPKLIRENLGNLIYLRWLFKLFKKKLRGETF
jgi:glycosyltransferase involved in cell wall biosynthesis